jgi:hypothetical protein
MSTGRGDNNQTKNGENVVDLRCIRITWPTTRVCLTTTMDSGDPQLLGLVAHYDGETVCPHPFLPLSLSVSRTSLAIAQLHPLLAVGVCVCPCVCMCCVV